jgi:flagellar protein FlgJ
MSDLTPSLPPARPASYHDFGGLASLRGEAAQGQAGAVREAAKQFEAYFIQQMLKTMREAVERSDLVDSQHSDMYQDLFDKEVSVKMAERGALGLADMLARNLAQQGVGPGVVSTQDALAARQQGLPLQPPARSANLGAQPLPLPPDAGGALRLPPTPGASPTRRPE